MGSEKAKFTEVTELAAKQLIRTILQPGDILSSGHCHLGGIDIWAEEIAKEEGCYDENYIFPPKILRWSGGFRERNLKIARNSEEVHNITVSEYPSDYKGMRFKKCYHCDTTEHVKSGGCWTAKKSKRAYWHVIYPDGSVKSSPKAFYTSLL